MKRAYQVVAGIIIQNDCVLCGQRGKGIFESKWEFPGGKIEVGETKEEALKREISEEICYRIGNSVFFLSADVTCEDFTIHLDTYLIDGSDCVPTANVHQSLKWVLLPELLAYDWCDADRIVVDTILRYGAKRLHEMLHTPESAR